MTDGLTGDLDLLEGLDLPGEDSAQAAPAAEADADQDDTAPDPDAPAESDANLRIEAKKFVFQALFEKASSVVPSKDIMPVLKNFQIDASAGRLRVVATDLELSVVSSTEMVMVAQPGVAVFPAKKTLEIIREAEDEDMVIDVNDGVAKITAGNTSWTLKLQSGDDYPPLPEVADLELHVVDRIKFLGALNSVRYAAATETTRPSLMMIDLTDGKMTACDGVRFQQAILEGGVPSMQLPIGAVDDLVKLLRTTDLAEIGIGRDDFHLVFRVGDDVFIANQLMAQFPDVEDLLLRPALENDKVLQLDRQDLAQAIKRVRINADPETSAILLELSADKVTVVARDKFGNEATEALTADWKSDERQVVVNHKYLTDMLNMYDGRSCKFMLGTDTKSRKTPVLLRDDETKTVGIIQQMRAEWVS